MSLESLKKYMGTNPKPEDFDEFWDKSLAEMRSVSHEAMFAPYEFPSAVAEFFELTFTSTKGARIYAKFARPKHFEGKIPAVLRFHGLSGNSGPWRDLINYVSEGYAVACMDCRGQGGYSEDVGGVTGTTFSTPFSRGLDGDPEDLYCRDVFLDTAMLARVITELDYIDETRIGVVGGSQGGGLAVACAALVPNVKLCATVFPYLSDYKRVWEMDLDK